MCAVVSSMGLLGVPPCSGEVLIRLKANTNGWLCGIPTLVLAVSVILQKHKI